MLSAYCKNCGAPKSVAEYTLDYCTGCNTAIAESQQAAAAEGTMTPLEAKSQALQRRMHTAHRTRPDPRFPISKADYWDKAVTERAAIEAGSEADPRRPGR